MVSILFVYNVQAGEVTQSTGSLPRATGGGPADIEVCDIGYCATWDGLVVTRVTGKDPTPGILNILSMAREMVTTRR